MEFRRIRLSGFKSFVEPVELRVEPGLTGVVGPNGCGKSNLLEAIRWAMGEGSPKSLRSGGMDDVIFAGTAARPARDFAEVLIGLDNRDRTAPAGWNDGDDIEVVRRIERGLGSAYRLNGRDARQRDIQMVFADNATGAHSPALVGQGRIGAIIAARPDERRALLEEAAGIAGLHVRRKEAEIRLRATEANLATLDEVLKGQEAQAASLRRQARSAARYAELSDRIRVAEAAQLFGRWRAAADAADAARAEAAAAEAAVAAATVEAARLATVQADAAAGLPALREAEARAAAALQALAQARAALEAERGRTAARVAELTAAHAQGDRDRAREAALGDEARAALARGEAEAGKVAAGRAEAEAALPGLAATVADAERAAQTGEAMLSEAIEARARAAAQARAADAAVAAAEARLARAEGERLAVERERTALAGGADDAAALAAAEATAAGASAAIETAAAALATAEAARTEAAAARDAAQAGAAAAKGEAAALTAERDALARALASDARAADALIDRVTVAAGYEAALAAALGDDLSAGTAGARRWALVAASGDPPLPAGARPLAELVSGPPELARRLAQVGVVDDGDGIALAAGQRLVARDGRLWRWDGYRSAGGEGRAAAERLTRRARLAAVEAELPGIAARLAGHDAAATAARDALAAAAAAEQAARADRGRAEQALAGARTEAARLAAAAAARTARLDAADAALARLVAEAAGHRAEADAARAAAADVTGLPALAEAVAGHRAAADRHRLALATARAAHDSAARRLDADARRLTELAADAAASTRRAAAATAQIAELDRRAGALAAEADMLAAAPARIAAEAADLATRNAAAAAQRDAAADRLASVEAGLRAADAQARAAAEALADAREGRARAATQAEHQDARRAELAAHAGDRFQTAPIQLPEALGFAPADAAALGDRFEGLTAERERLGPVNLRAGIELAEIEGALATATAERAELDTAIARLRGSIGALNREGRLRLSEAFAQVDAHFRTLFGTLFEGGSAHLALTESDDPLLAGLEIMAQPPGKRLQSLTLLSGGEQALTAIALIFALFLTTPSPLCVLDEVDAPLDDANVERFCDLLDHMTATTPTRFLIVTHNAVTMSRMHRLYGVTMAEPGVSQLVSVDLAGAERMVA